ncbi:MAG: hypothetical protein K2Q01_10695, partial [Rickettsiales bacterium]|nr:hypothetical protein [Rickettsiales bacterium]
MNPDSPTPLELPALHPLLSYKAKVTGDEAVMPVYHLSQDTCRPYVMSKLDAAEGFQPHELPLIPSMQMLPTHALQDRGQRKKLLKTFTAQVLPETVLPWLSQQCKPEGFLLHCHASANQHLISLCRMSENPTIQAAELAQSLRAAFPHNAAIQTLTNKETTDSFYYAPNAVAHFYDELEKGGYLPTLAEQRTLNDTLRQLYEKHNKREEFNTATMQAPYNVGTTLGMNDAEINSIVVYKNNLPPPKDVTRRIHINEHALPAVEKTLLRRMQTELPKRMQANMETAASYLTDLKTHIRTTNFNTPELTPDKARAAFIDALQGVPARTLAARLMKVGLSNPKLEVVMVDGNDTTGFWSKFDAKKAKTLKNEGIGGYSETTRDRVYIGKHKNRGSTIHNVMEEVLHHSFAKLYNDNGSQTTYPPDFGKNPKDSLFLRDDRKQLFLEAMRSDMNI